MRGEGYRAPAEETWTGWLLVNSLKYSLPAVCLGGILFAYVF